jgi:hypothetical protein
MTIARRVLSTAIDIAPALYVDVLSLVGALGVGLLLRLLQFSAPFWYDEAFTAMLSRLPFERMMAAVIGDVHPPLYYLLTHGWQPGALRWLSLGAGLVCIVAAYALAPGRLGGHGAAWLVALSPFMIYYSAEARAYALIAALYALLILTVEHRRVWLTTILTGALWWTHYYAPVYVGTLFIYALARRKWPAAFALGAGSLLFIPWLTVLAYQLQLTSAGYWMQPPDAENLLHLVYLFTFGSPNLQITYPTLLTLFGLIALAAWHVYKNRASWPIAFLAAFPVFGVALATQFAPYYLYRALIGAGVAWLVLVANALASLDLRGRAWAVVGMGLLLTLANVTDQMRPAVTTRSGVSQMAHIIAQQNPDAIYHLSLDSMVELNGNGYTLPDSYIWMPNSAGLGTEYSTLTLTALGWRVQAPPPTAKNILLIIPVNKTKEEQASMAKRYATLAEWLRLYPHELVYSTVDPWEIYGVEVWRLWR